MSITLGCDPEFGFVKGNTLIKASDIITGYSGGKFGVDGCEFIAEIRPSPAMEPEELVKNIKGCLINGYKKYPRTHQLTWKAGSTVKNYAIGGHIHFGISATPNMVNALDCYLAQPILMLEKRNEAVTRRCSQGYGHLGNIRNQDWGFEYRTLGSWITSPKVAIGVLSLAKCIVQQCWKSSRFGAHLATTIKPNLQHFDRADFDYFRPRMENLYSDIKRMYNFHRYENEINLIFKMIQYNKTWFPEQGLKEAWGISSPEVLKELPQISAQELWNRKTINIY